MSELLPIVLAGIFLVIISDKLSKKRIDDLGNEEYEKKDVFVFLIMTIIMAGFVGLRRYYNDTGVYYEMYQNVSLGENLFSNIDWNISSNFGFVIIERIIKSFSFSAQSFLMITSLFSIGVFYWFIRKYSTMYSLSIYYFITMGVFTFSMGALRQILATAIALIAINFLLKKRLIYFFLLTFFAVTIHQFAFVFFLVPLLDFSPWSKKTYLMVLFFAVLSFGMKGFMGSIGDVASSVGGEGKYDANSFSDAGVNIFRLFVVWVPVVLSFPVKEKLICSDDKTSNLMINLSMLNAEIMLLGLFGTANYFARLANFFAVFQTISLPYIIRLYEKDIQKILLTFSVIGFAIYFTYDNTIVNGGFDSQYFGISLERYFTEIFD